MEDPQLTIYKREYGKFERDVIALVNSAHNHTHGNMPTHLAPTQVDDSHFHSHNHSLSGRPRTTLRKILAQIAQTADIQLEPAWQMKLFQGFANDLQSMGEHTLAIECFENVLQRCEKIVEDKLTCTRIRVETAHKMIESKHVQLIGSSKYSRIAPIVVSQVLVILQDLRTSLEELFELSTKQQEELAWMVLNGCKLLLKIAQPLVWLNCGKYISESLMFAGVCMESIINLCTARHLKFRMKLYISAYYATLVQGTNEESQCILKHAAQQVKDLRDREELDPPVPDKVQGALLDAEVDLAIMRMLHVFWNDSDSIDVVDEAATRVKYACPPAFGFTNRTFADRCLAECTRVQQLTCGNANEPWRKRSGSILKAAWKCISSYPVPEVGAETSDQVSSAQYPISLECLVEIAIIAIFDQTEGIPISEMLDKIWTISKTVSRQQLLLSQSRGDGEEKSSTTHESSMPLMAMQELLLLQQFIGVVDMTSTGNFERLAASLKFAAMIHEMLFSSQVRRRRTLLQRLSLGIWTKYIYPTMQEILSAEQSSTTLSALIELAPGLMAANRALELTGLEDPVLIGAVGLLCSIVLKYLGDPRAAIALLRQTLDTIDEHRAARVDLNLHMPEDVRDVSALQRGSFTTRSESADWFYSIKRLGAHAFAGFGIFGASSSADRTDQALAEMHADMLSLYFRYEIEYGIQQKLAKLAFKRAQRVRNDGKGRPALNLAGSTSSEGAVDVDGNKETQIDQTIKEAQAFTQTIIQSATAVIQTGISSESLKKEVGLMKAYCGKSSYAKCILYLEMARVEVSEETCLELLTSARACVEEAEAKEQTLKDAFNDLTVVTVKDEQRPPIVLARSHKFVYVAPVGTKKALGKAKYFRIFAKEIGSGTSVSIANDDLAGCERQIWVSDMHSPVSAAAKIHKLRSGERYLFAYAAFGEDGKQLSSISRSSVPIDAVNPLPTILLWSFCNKVAFELRQFSIGKAAARMVCNRYFLTVPRPDNPITIGKGINLFLNEDPSICMLAVHQSSPMLLSAFVSAFLTLETPLNKPAPGLSSVHFELRKDTQNSSLSSLKRAALVALVACYSFSQELVVRCVVLGYELAADLLLFDESHLSHAIQGPILMLIVALQTIPKTHWHELEHKLYARLLQHVVRLAVLNRNISSVIPVLSELFPESSSGQFNLSSEIEQQYRALKGALKLADGLIVKSVAAAESHIGAMLNSVLPPATTEIDVETPGEAWKLSSARRLHAVQCACLPLLNATPDAAQLSGLLKEVPIVASDLLAVVVTLGKEALLQGQPMLLPKALSAVSLFDNLFCLATREANDFWELKVLIPLLPGGLAAAIAAAKVITPVPTGKNVPAKAVPAPEEPELVQEEGAETKSEVPLRFTETTAEEEKKQLAYLAELAELLAISYNTTKKEYFPHSKGPDEPINPLNPASLLPEKPPFAVSENGEVSPNDPVHPEILFAKYICASIALSAKSGRAASAVHSCVALWNFLTDRFISPREFAELLSNNKQCVLAVASSLVNMLEELTQVEPMDDGPANVTLEGSEEDGAILIENAVEMIQSSTPPRIVKEYLYAVRGALIFFIKVLWLQMEYLETVDIGVRSLHVFMKRAPEFTKLFGDAIFPLLIHAQEQLIASAKGVVAETQSVMDNCVIAFEEYMKKKRRKKTRLVKVEKDDDELAHDAEVAIIQGTVDAAQAALDTAKARLLQLKHQQKRFDTMSSTGVQLLDKVRKLSQQIIEDCTDGKYGQINIDTTALSEKTFNFPELLACSSSLQERLDAALDQFSQVAQFLREKKDRDTLIEALKEQGDILLLFGKTDEARGVWHDGIDGFFNVMDSVSKWQEVASAAIANLNSNNVSGMLPVVVILGKLSRYCAAGDRDMKAVCCRLAAKLCLAPFFESTGHPSSLVGFAAYVCTDFNGLASLSANTSKLSPTALCIALDEILRVLCAEKCCIEALPVVCLLEHLHGYYVRSPEKWLSARMIRLRILIDSHLFAEAASMLASIRHMIVAITRHSYGAPLLAAALTPNTIEDFDSRKNGLDFFGKAPFANHLSPIDPKNVEATSWIAQFPAEYKAFVASYLIQLPDTRTEEQKAVDNAAVVAAAAAAEAASKGKKGKAPDSVSEILSSTNLVAPLFPGDLEREILLICAYFLVELSMTDTKVTTAYNAQLALLATQGMEFLTKTEEMLAASLVGGDASGLKDASWASQYGRCRFLQARVLLARRKYKAVRASMVSVLQLLSSRDATNSSLAFQPETKFELSELWLRCRYILAQVSERQARFVDCIQSSTTLANEAASNFCGIWLRAALLQRAGVNFKLGNMSSALTDCDAILNQYTRNFVQDQGMVRTLVLKVSVLRAMNLNSSPDKVVLCYSTCLTLLRRALRTAETLAQDAGFLGADANTTYFRSDTKVLKHHLLAPLLHNLTAMHPNEPALTITANFNPKVVAEVAGVGSIPPRRSLSKEEQEEYEVMSFKEGGAWGMRSGPVDASESVYTQSEFSNIYLTEVRCLAVLYAALTTFLDDVRLAGAQTSFDPREGVSPDWSVLETRLILREQSAYGEEALKILRHSLFINPLVRCSLLLSVGKSRYASIKQGALIS